MIKQAFYKSIPVMAGYIVLGTGFGILMHNAGYGVLWTAAMSIFIYAGSMQYVGVNLLTGGASVITTALTTVMVNARHLFYSISMVDLYKDAGKYKPYMIFALTDETYSLLCDGNTPEGSDPNEYRFFVSMFNQSYWVTGSVLGSLLGAVIPFSTAGIEFSMTALFIAAFTEQWLTTRDHIPALTGLLSTLVCLVIFGRDRFLIPAMLLITLVLTLLRGREESRAEEEPHVREESRAEEEFRKKTPPYITYLGKVLPPAIIGMLVIYCLKDITPLVQPYGLPELIAAGCVVGAQVLKRNSLISILLGTAVYMVLIRTVF